MIYKLTSNITAVFEDGDGDEITVEKGHELLLIKLSYNDEHVLLTSIKNMEITDFMLDYMKTKGYISLELLCNKSVSVIGFNVQKYSRDLFNKLTLKECPEISLYLYGKPDYINSYNEEELDV